MIFHHSVSTLSAGIQTIVFTRNHSFAGIVYWINQCADQQDLTNGTYYNVKLSTDDNYNPTTFGMVLLQKLLYLVMPLLISNNHPDLDIRMEHIFDTNGGAGTNNGLSYNKWYFFKHW